MRAKDAMHFKHPGPPTAQGEGAKPLLINFTSAQQNCMRARGGRHNGWDDSANGRRGGERGGERGYSGRAMGGGASRRPPERSPGSELPARSRALYLGSVPDTAELEDLAALIEPLAIVESLRLVRTKSCAFINLCHEEVAEALHAKFTSREGAEAPLILGKTLTVNFAKARPCTDEQLAVIADGARRRLRVIVASSSGFGEARLRAAVGTKAESILHVSQEPLTPAEEAEVAQPSANAASDRRADADDEQGGGGATATDDGETVAEAEAVGASPAYHALCVSFSSVMAAMAAS